MSKDRSKDRNKDQVDGNIKRNETGLPDRSGRLTGHTKQPLKGTDPKTADQEGKRLPEPKPDD